jgi:hypothetical protein
MAQPNIPLPSEGASGVKPDGTATATCLCGAVQLSFVRSPSLSLRGANPITNSDTRPSPSKVPT